MIESHRIERISSKRRSIDRRSTLVNIESSLKWIYFCVPGKIQLKVSSGGPGGPAVTADDVTVRICPPEDDSKSSNEEEHLVKEITKLK